MDFVLVNRSTLVSDRQVKAMSAALDVQMFRDVMPSWRRLATSVRAGQVQNTGDLAIMLQDVLDDPTALGYHTEDGGRIYGVIGCKAILDAGGGVLAAGPSGDSVSAVVSHEIIEAKFDPNCNLYADTLGTVPGWSSMAYELCDPVQASGYEISGVYVSNFVLPSYFDPEGPGPWDFMKRLAGPFQLETGGYAVLRNGQGTEQAVFANHDARPWRAHGRSRHRVSR